jgi:hypothetical protein
MRWIKIHVSAAVAITAAWCLHDAVVKDELGWVVIMAFIVGLNVLHVREAICED